MSSKVPAASCEAPLKPNQPNHRMKVPSAAIGMLEPGIGFTVSPKYLPIRGPMMIAPIRAAQPPVECTRVEPAKSEKPHEPSR